MSYSRTIQPDGSIVLEGEEPGLSADEMPSGIDAAKIGAGAVSNTEFGYLDGVTSALQTQLTAKASLSGATFTGNLDAPAALIRTSLQGVGANIFSGQGYTNSPTFCSASVSGEATLGGYYGVSNQGSAVTAEAVGGPYTGSLRQSAPLTTRANSTAYAICHAVAGNVARILLQDDSSKRAVALIDTAGAVTFESGSHADYVSGSSPGAGEVGVYVSGSPGVAYLKPGSAATRKISVIAQIGIA